MFQTKSALRATIRKLELELETERHRTRRSALVEAAGLPKCESMACINCVHAVFQRSPMGAVFLLGCGKNRKCKDFTPDNIRTLYPQHCYEALQKDLEERCRL